MAIPVQPHGPPTAKWFATYGSQARKALTNTAIGRVRSIDALRGFDMLWIIGGDAVVASIANRTKSDQAQSVLDQFSTHSVWSGLTFYDLIFPLFLFIMGVALPHSIGERLKAGEPRKALVLKAVKRTALLIFLGFVYNGILSLPDWHHFRPFGVLQRLAIAYFAASMLLIFTKPRTQIVVAAGLLAAYWALMVSIPVPGVPLGSMTPYGNVANYLDRLMLAPHQMFTRYGDPEGLLSNIPAITSCLIGVFAGYWLQSSATDRKKAAGLVVAGLVCIGLGLLWAPSFPIIKKIWTSSYVLVAGGISLELLAIFYWVIDVKGISKWAIPLVVIGMNPLLVYMLSEIVDFEGIAGYFINGPVHHLAADHDLAIAIGSLTVKWLLLYFLYRQKIFVRI